MTIYEKIQALCKENSTNITQIEETCGLSQNSIKKWDTRKSLPSGTALVKLVKHFNVSADYLLGLSEVRTPAVSGVPNSIVENWSKLNDSQKKQVVKLIDTYLEQQEINDITTISSETAINRQN